MEEVKYIPPEYRITDRMLTLIVEGEKMLKDISNSDLSASSSSKLIQEAIIENLHAVSRLLGSPITRGEAKKIAVGKMPAGRQFKVISNYRSAMEYIRNVSGTGIGEFTTTVINHLNKLLGENVYDDWDLGRARAPGDAINEEFEPFTPKKVDATLVSKTLPDLVVFLEQKQEVHPVIRATILLSDLTQLYPFINLNSTTVFACFDLFLNMKAAGAGGMVPVWQLASENTEEFAALFSEVVATGEGLDRFLEFIIVGWHKSVETVRREAVKLSYNEEIKGKAKFLNLNHRQLAALRYLQRNVKVTRRQYMKLFKVSTMTAYRDLSDMQEKKLLDCQGHGRGTYYVLVTKG